MKFMLAALFALGASAQTSKLIGTKQDCCRYNGANVGNVKNADSFDKCEAGCKANQNCNFFSYNKSWKACSLCSKCDLSSKSHGRHYDSWEMIFALKTANPLCDSDADAFCNTFGLLPKPNRKCYDTKEDCIFTAAPTAAPTRFCASDADAFCNKFGMVPKPNRNCYDTEEDCQTTIPVDVEFEVAGETEETFTEDKQTAFINAISAELGIDASLITLTVGVKPNPIARRLVEGDALLITITITLKAEQISAKVEKLESPALVATIAASTGITATFEAFKPAKTEGGVSPLCARCKWENNRIVVEHFINAQKHGEKGLQHKCYHLGDKCVCKCKAAAFSDGTYREGNKVLGRITPGPKYGTPGLNWDNVADNSFDFGN